MYIIIIIIFQGLDLLACFSS